MPFGYGPAAKLLTLARSLQGRGLRLVLVGHGIALELASRTPDLFDEVVPASPNGAREAAVRGAVGVLSVMDRELARAAAITRTPLYVVDSLLWMRDEVPTAFREARRYWAQDFLGLRAVSGNYQPAPTIVGPILPSGGFRREAAPAQLLINLGGCESPDGADANARAYADFVVEGVLNSSLAARFAGRTTVMAGTRCIDALRARYAACDVECVSLPHGAAMERLARAALVLTSPGLTMTLESFQGGVPTYFLPPQNYSQWCTLRLLRDAGLAPHALHWEDLSAAPRLRDRAPESERNPLVRAAVARFTSDGEARARFAQCLAAVGRADHGALAAAQSRFFASLGPNGALAIARELVEDLQSGEPRQHFGVTPSESRLASPAE
jgi:hypothetical protein